MRSSCLASSSAVDPLVAVVVLAAVLLSFGQPIFLGRVGPLSAATTEPTKVLLSFVHFVVSITI